MSDEMPSDEYVAIVGMAGRFPGARTVDEFWQNLRDGVESVEQFSDDDLRQRGMSDRLIAEDNYVKAGTIVDDLEMFDAAFFGISPGEAAVTDPQQRLFLQGCWEAMENSGYAPGVARQVGVFASAGANTYRQNIDFGPGGDVATSYRNFLGNDKDFLATRIAYYLNLTGPALTVQTACSSSLVAVHLACQNLLTYQCDMALAGGVSIFLPQGLGHTYQDGMILSPDGHCRAFDANGQGIVPGRGLGVVVLKRLSEALDDGDRIDAVIRGTAINNDGSFKVGFTAPSVDGQAEAIAMALAAADVDADTIRYVEAHGTGTPLGDPIEIAALTKAYRDQTDACGFCKIGSVKTNVGHLDTAAGITSLIKTVLVLKQREVPPSLNFEIPNPEIDFEATPFVVNDKLSTLEPGSVPLRAGVSSFGMGGTNAHAVLEEAPLALRRGHEDGPEQEVLVWSAKTPEALVEATDKLSRHLAAIPTISLADAAYTLQTGRKHFKFRRTIVGLSVDDVRAQLMGRSWPEPVKALDDRDVVFMCSGQGSQYAGMGAGLYRQARVFRETFDDCAKLLADISDIDLADILYDDVRDLAERSSILAETAVTQPALFVIEYSMAKLWMSLGITPAAIVGHSIGEYVAACLAGVFTLEDALHLVVKRGRMMQDQPKGSMIAVPLSEDRLVPHLTPELSIAAINAPNQCVVAGEDAAIDELANRLQAAEIRAQRLRTSHAFHSAMMEPILGPFADFVGTLSLREPELPFMSNVTGDWITAADATDPHYWARHIRGTVRFADCIGGLLDRKQLAFLEVGPGNTLVSFVRQHEEMQPGEVLVSSLRRPQDKREDVAFMQNALVELWQSGVEPDWQAVHAERTPRRVAMPTYPFARTRHWIDPASQRQSKSDSKACRSFDDWFYVPNWIQAPSSVAAMDVAGREDEGGWLVLSEDDGLGPRLVERLKELGQEVIVVKPGSGFEAVDQESYRIDPKQRDDYDALIENLDYQRRLPSVVVHLWCGSEAAGFDLEDAALNDELFAGFFSLVFLGRALAARTPARSIKVNAITTNAIGMGAGDSDVSPVRAMASAPLKVMPQECPHLRCTHIDLQPGDASSYPDQDLDLLLGDLASERTGDVLAYRDGVRWAQGFSQIQSGDGAAGSGRLRQRGVYLITGGLGRIGMAMATYLAEHCKARLALLGRSGLPPREQWPDASSDPELRRRIDGILKLEELGADVMIAKTDVTNLSELRDTVAQTVKHFGPLDGVIHAAGDLGEGAFCGLSDLDASAADRHFLPKLYGLRNLAEAIEDQDLDFCLLTSSLSSILGGLGYCAYAGANIFMDAFSLGMRRRGHRSWMIANWDAWIAAQTDEQVGDQQGLTAKEGVQTFERILGFSQASQIVVSQADLQESLARWIHLEGRSSSVEGGAEAGAGQGSDGVGNASNDEGSAAEQTLARIWRSALGVADVGVHDNFFDLGGDSLTALSIASQARSASIMLSPNQILETPTIAELCAQQDVESEVGSDAVDQAGGTSADTFPLTPFMHRFLNRPGNHNPHQWNISELVSARKRLSASWLKEAFAYLMTHHDAFQFRVVDHDDGTRHATLDPDIGMERCFSVVDLTDVPVATRSEALASKIQNLHASFHLSDGPVAHMALFDMGEQEPQRLLLVVHHFSIEGISWSIFWQQFEQVYRQLERGETPNLPGDATSFKAWTEDLARFARSERVGEDARKWLGNPWSEVPALPMDNPAADRRLNTNGSAAVITETLSREDTSQLLRGAAGGFPTETIIAAALVSSLTRFQQNPYVFLQRLIHGRSVGSGRVDVSEGIGCFICYTSALFRLDSDRSLRGTLVSIKDQLQAQSRSGVHVDLARFLNEGSELASSLEKLPKADVLLNYRGKAEDNVFAQSDLFEKAREDSGADHDPEGLRDYALSVLVDIIDDQMLIKFVYSKNLHEEATIASLARDNMDFIQATIAELADGSDISSN